MGDFSVAELVRDGVTGPARVLSVRAAAEVLALFERALAAQQRHAPSAPDLAGWHRSLPWARELASLPALVGAIETALGGVCTTWATEFWVKPPGSAMTVPWHQDEAFFPARSIRTVSAWIALTEASAANGGLALVRGSHARAWRHDAVDEALGGLDRGVLAAGLPGEQVWFPALAPGEALLFDARTVHGSPPNPSPRPRIGYSVRYTLAGTGADGTNDQPAAPWNPISAETTSPGRTGHAGTSGKTT